MATLTRENGNLLAVVPGRTREEVVCDSGLLVSLLGSAKTASGFLVDGNRTYFLVLTCI